MIPPAFIYMRIGRVPMPLPVVVLWPLLLGLLLTAAVILPLVPVRGTTVGQRAQAPFALWRLLAAARGLSVHVRSGDGHAVRISCW
jgi:hypothetical protein